MKTLQELEHGHGHHARANALVVVIVATVMVIVLAACGASDPTSAHPSAPAGTDTGAKPDATAALARLRLDDVSDPPPASTQESAMGDMDIKGPHPAHRIADPALRARYDRQLTLARRAAARFPRLKDALAAGYIVTPFREAGVGVHAVNWSLVGAFDAARPAMLLFDGLDPSARLLALSYYIESAPDRQPQGFAGSNDHWHNHVDICIADGKLLATVHQPDACANQHGTYLTGRNLWMLHAWVVAGQTNPWGVFATYNPRVDDATPSPS